MPPEYLLPDVVARFGRIELKTGGKFAFICLLQNANAGCSKSIQPAL